eukprot:gene4488-814_t
MRSLQQPARHAKFVRSILKTKKRNMNKPDKADDFPGIYPQNGLLSTQNVHDIIEDEDYTRNSHQRIFTTATPISRPNNEIDRPWNDPKVVTVFGGSGFMGKNIIKRLAQIPTITHIKACSRYPDDLHKQVAELQGSTTVDIVPTYAELLDRHSCLAACGVHPHVHEVFSDSHAALGPTPAHSRCIPDGSDTVINATGLSYESTNTFGEVHIEGANHVSHSANLVGAERLVVLTHLAAALDHRSYWADTKFRQEDVSFANFYDATVVRPGIIIGKGNPELELAAKWLRMTFPFYPCFHPRWKLRPVMIDDVCEAVAKIVTDSSARAQTFDLMSDDTTSHWKLANRVFKHMGMAPRIPIPLHRFFLGLLSSLFLQWTPGAAGIHSDRLWVLEQPMTGRPPSPSVKTFMDLGITPTPI